MGPGFRQDSADKGIARDMTELLFRDDGYLSSCGARVTQADERGIWLDRTVFYPVGGGQPGDAGALRSRAHCLTRSFISRYRVRRSPSPARNSSPRSTGTGATG